MVRFKEPSQNNDSAILSGRDPTVLQNNSLRTHWTSLLKRMPSLILIHNNEWQNVYIFTPTFLSYFSLAYSFNTGLRRHNKATVTLQSGGWFKTPAGLRRTESQQLLRSQHLRPTTSKWNKCSLSVFMSVLLIDRKSIFKGIFLSPIHPRIYSTGVYDRP